MATDEPQDDLRALWQAQPIAALDPSVAQIQARAEGFGRTIARRNWREHAAAGIVAVVFGLQAILTDDTVVRVGCVLVLAATAWVAWYIHAHGTAGSAQDGLPCVAFYRRELVHQRDLLRGVWSWYLGPLVPGLVVTLIGRGAGAIDFVVCAAIFLAIGWLNHRGSAALQQQIDALPPDP